MNAGEDVQIVCRILDIGPTVLTEWRFAFAGAGLSFFELKDYSQRQGHLSVAQEMALADHFTNSPSSSADEVCAYVLVEYGQNYCTSGAVKLMHRLGFVYKKPQSLPAQADEAKQEVFIAAYKALMTGLRNDEMVVFSDAVHPTHQSRPAHGWFPKYQKTALKTSSGRGRLNIQGALNLETFNFTFVEAEKINALTTRQMLEKLEQSNPAMAVIHVFVDNAQQNAYIERYNRTVRTEWLGRYHFGSIEDVQDHATRWLWTYNNERPNIPFGIYCVNPAGNGALEE